ncbi:hypothetical protein [Streptomyces sp. MB09-02B]|uniref:hypothetical protein n=1 Tax=Streptomyces sp. MB09-02B TaxID=3028667 RepID=UPI0029A8C03B|nr:hypothetical protein [Streptomyces sp. MB09-02B]MDX3642163.1 hypothetical protein [Streptomyces sp. MB09-02B]
MNHHDEQSRDNTHDKQGKHDRRGGKDEPDTALDEILREAERAETDVTDSRPRRHDGEAGDAITPNERAQEESHHD